MDHATYYKTYILADFLDDMQCRENVVDIMISKLADWGRIYPTRLAKIWDLTQSGSPLRTVHLHWMMAKWPRDHIAWMLDGGELPEEFVKAALLLAFDRVDNVSYEKCERTLRGLLLSQSRDRFCKACRVRCIYSSGTPRCKGLSYILTSSQTCFIRIDPCQSRVRAVSWATPALWA